MLEPAIKPPSDFMALLRGTPLADCFAFWRSVRGDGPVPPKARIDPVAMPRHILPYLFLHERTPEGRFRCRLSGTGLCAVFQADITGRHLDETLPPEVLQRRIPLYQGVLERAVPVVFTANVANADRNWIKFHRLMLPISFAGDRADGVFGMVVFPELGRGLPGRPAQQLSLPEVVAWATPEDLAGD